MGLGIEPKDSATLRALLWPMGMLSVTFCVESLS